MNETNIKPTSKNCCNYSNELIAITVGTIILICCVIIIGFMNYKCYVDQKQSKLLWIFLVITLLCLGSILYGCVNLFINY